MSSDPPIRRSIEVEYWVIDDAGRLTPPGDLVDVPGAEREFVEPILEIKTTPCETTAELRAELFGRIHNALDRAADRDKGLVPLATPLTSEEISEIPCDRTRIQNTVVGEDFEYVRHCAGTHVHVEQLPGRAVDQLNTLIALDPALALFNSASHCRGEQLATGARSKCYRRLAYDGLPNQGELWSYVEDREDWTQRLRACYDEFRERALASGVADDTFADCFEPESAVWTPVKLRESFGTVEWRSPDTTLPSQTIKLADTLAAITDTLRDCEVEIGGETPHIGDDTIVLPEFDTVTDHVDTAIHDGLTAPLRAYLERMSFEPSTYEPLSRTLDQEHTHDEPLTSDTARQLRLEYADRLRSEVVQNEPLIAD
ncbi:MAG: hypothetical protein A07HN63_00395 [uncultured archaeon A07HN63]|nr:MAG: hypothetical protein A07HN63_00395 [uncultured archaeon A07HN63]